MTDIDMLMAKDSTKLSDQDLTEIIRYHRDQRMRKATGEKTARPTADLSSLREKLLASAPRSTQKFTRRI